MPYSLLLNVKDVLKGYKSKVENFSFYGEGENTVLKKCFSFYNRNSIIIKLRLT